MISPLLIPGGRWHRLEPGDRLEHPGAGGGGRCDGGGGGARALRGLHPPGGQEDQAGSQGHHEPHQHDDQMIRKNETSDVNK